MGFIKDFFDKQKAKSILRDYEDAVYLDDTVENIHATIDDAITDIDRTFARFSYFYLNSKTEMNAVNLLTFFNYCRIKKLPLSSYDKWESVVVGASKELFTAVNINDTKYPETHLCLATYYLTEGKASHCQKVLAHSTMASCDIDYVRAVVEAGVKDYHECVALLIPYSDDATLLPMAKILLSRALVMCGDIDKANDVLSSIDTPLTTEERGEYLYLLLELGLYDEAISYVKGIESPSHYDAYAVVVASYGLGKEVIETGIMDSDMLRSNVQYLSNDIYSPYYYNEVRSNELIDEMQNDELFDTATPEFRLMRQNEILDTLAVFYNGVRYLEFVDTYIV